ncbi:MAG: S-layer homology domain-containing protein [Lacrimispora sp.]|uniref:S-layer homology domain-containing protein n=1 Tax=Lacrimispora sp. TaxID=2719234 RepID=UPI0039E5153A
MNRRQLIHRVTAMMLSVIIVAGMIPVSVSADTDMLPSYASGEITVFEALEPDIAVQSVPLGTSQEDLKLPYALTVTMRLAALEEEPVPDSGEADVDLAGDGIESGFGSDVDGLNDGESGAGDETASPSEAEETASPSDAEETGGSSEAEPQGDDEDAAAEITVSLPVTWASSPEYDGSTPGEYIFTPEIPKGYTFADGIVIPQITVAAGLAMRLALTGTGADYSWYDDNIAASEFEISDAAQLQGLADIVNGTRGSSFDFSGRTISLMDDIDLSGYDNWTPIGTASKPFSGTFEGNGNTISNLKISAPNTDHVGLFGMVKGSISNLIVTKVHITGKEKVGAIAGELWGSVTHSAVAGGTVFGNGYIGGIVGWAAYDQTAGSMMNSSIESSFSACDVRGIGLSPFNAGGVAGSVSYGTIINCYSLYGVMGEGVSGYLQNVGGVAGSVRQSTLKNCFALGEIRGSMSVGGIVGSISGSFDTPSALENCAALNVSVRGDYSGYGGPKVGRLVGGYDEWYTDITGSISFSGMSKTGGGGNDGTGRTAAEIKAEDFFTDMGYPSGEWEFQFASLPVLSGFPEGIQTGDIPQHLSPILPSVPREFIALHGDRKVTLKWSQPARAGENPILRYEVRKDNDAWISVDKSKLTYDFTGLTNGTAYTFRVRAVNSNGNGSLAIIQKTPGKISSAPQNLMAYFSDDRYTAAWDAPSDPGTGEILYYEVRYTNNPYWLETAPWFQVQGSFSCKLMGLGISSWCYVQVRAVNRYGTSAIADWIPDQVPTPPRDLKAVRGNRKITLSWAEPSFYGGDVVSGYQVFHPVTKTWLSAGMGKTYTVSGLTNGETYRFMVRASNSYFGTGIPAALTIDPREPPVIYTGSSLIWSYGDPISFQVQATGQTPFSFSLIGAPTGVSIENTGFVFLDGTTPAGTHTFTIKVSNDSPPDAMQNFTLIVTRYTPKFGDLQFNPITDRTYDGTATGIGPVSDKKGLGLSINVYYEGRNGTVYPQSMTPPKDAGDYQVTVSIAESANINGVSFPLASYSILPKSVTVIPVGGQSKMYGQPDPVLKYTVSPSLESGDSLPGALGRNPGNRVGSYGVTQGTLLGSSNYTLSFSGTTVYFAITPKNNASFSIAPISSEIYTGSAFTPEPEVRDEGTLLTKGVDFTYSYENNVNAGTSATVRITGIGDYAGSISSAAFTIGKADNTLSISCADITYGQVPAPSVVTNTGGGTVSYEYKVRGSDDGTYASVIPADAGSYTVRGTSAPTANYNSASAAVDFTIDKADNTLNISCPDITYGQTPSPTADTNASAGLVSYEYKVQGANDSTYTSIVPAATGSYTVRGTSTATSNYNAATATADFDINKAAPPLTLTADPADTRPRPGSVTLIAALPTDATGTLIFRAGMDTLTMVTLPDNTALFVPAGVTNEYGFTVEYSGDSNYESKTSMALEYRFTKSEQADVIAADSTICYGETLDLSTLVSGGSGTGALCFTVTGGPGQINGTTLIPTGAGEVNITATKAEDHDYKTKSAGFNVTVNSRVITFAVASVGMQDYTGSPVTPTPEVWDGTTVLTEGVHYTYSYDNNTDAGALAAIHVTGAGPYAGSTGSASFIIGRIIPVITRPPAVSGTVYTGTPLPQILLTGGSASASGHFEWVNSSNAAVYGPNTFEVRFVPEDPILYTEVSGINVTFHAVNHNSRNTAAVPAVMPNQPTAANVEAAAQVENGNAALTITDSMVKAAIDQALAAAKTRGNTANGISVNISVAAAGAVRLDLTLERAALNRLLEAGVTSFHISSLLVNMSFDRLALKEIQEQSSGNLAITVNPAAVTGLRNAFDITLGSEKDGKAVNITSLGTGTSILSIPAEPGKDESEGCLYGAYVGLNNQIIRIADSAYDANSRRMIFSTGHFSVYGVGYAAPDTAFTDINAHWAKEAIDYAAGRGLVSGASETAFEPNSAMTREMLAAALGRLAGADTGLYTTSSFADVKADSAFQPYIEWAYKKGIMQGSQNQQFAPDRAVTREEMAVIFANYAKAAGQKLPVIREAAVYEDASRISGTCKTAVTAMQQAGIMMGGMNNRFNPKSKTTRAEVSSMLYRYIKVTIDPAAAQGWALNDAGQHLYYKDGKALAGTQIIGGVKYFFETTGILKTGWVKDGHDWHFYSGNTMLVGWLDMGSDGGSKRYYFDPYGNMAAGKRLKIDSGWYYFNPDGSLAGNAEAGESESGENGVRKTE